MNRKNCAPTRFFRLSEAGETPEFKIPSPSLKRKYLSEENSLDVAAKIAAARVSPCVVGVSTHGSSEKEGDECWSNGTIIESQNGEDDDTYFSIILASATLFKHEGLQPHQVKVHVYLSDNEYEGELVACDFHYNLAAIRIQTNSLLQAATLRGLDDIFPVDPTQQLQLCEGSSFQLRSHSELFKMIPGTKVICLGRSCMPRRRHLLVASGVCCMRFSSLDCNELYWISDLKKFDDGGPVCNYHGEVIGIMFFRSPFLPINIVSRWWKHYKSCGEFCRPWLGLKVANLHVVNLDFLKPFVKAFPDVSTGVVVLKIAEDSPAYCSKIQPKDVIIKCDERWVRSNLEFFEILWEKAGKSVDFTVLRTSTGSQENVSMTIEETAPDNFYQWHRPNSWPDKKEGKSSQLQDSLFPDNIVL